MTPDQLQDAEWTPEMWDSLNELARKVVEERAQLRKVIPRGPDAPNAYTVSVPRIVKGAGIIEIDTNASKPVTRIRYKLRIKAHQLHDLATIKLLVIKTAEQLARLEDFTLAFGNSHAFPDKGVSTLIENLVRSNHLVRTPAPRSVNVITSIIEAAHEIRQKDAIGPLHAVLGSKAWDELAKKDVGARVPGLEEAKHALGSPEARLARLPAVGDDYDHTVTVFSASPTVLDLVWAQPVRMTHVGTDDGDLMLRLEQAFYLRIIDTELIKTVKLVPPQAKANPSS